MSSVTGIVGSIVVVNVVKDVDVDEDVAWKLVDVEQGLDVEEVIEVAVSKN